MNNTKIYFICPKSKKPTGGIKQIYRQVDILNKNGFNAVILHKKLKYKCSWFLNQTIVESNLYLFKQIDYYLHYQNHSKIKSFYKKLILNIYSFFSKKTEPNSIFVFPEVIGDKINLIEPNSKKVIFNQNCYYTFLGYPLDFDINKSPYIHSNTIATIVVSEDSKTYIEYAFQNLNLYRIRLGIDKNVFYPKSNKKKQIAFMPRKLEKDVHQVLNILQQRNFSKDWTFVAIDNKSESQVAQIMQESYIFLSFNQTEGFGLPPAEAMACGSIVIGYSGRGGREYFKDNLTYEIEDRDIMGFASKIEEITNLIDKDENSFIVKGEKASEYILNEYNLKNEENDVIHIWKDIFGKKLN
jgi:glycosyltransferase involved in cell wall biosynthesis